MNTEFYRKLVDLYVAGELSEDLAAEVEIAAFKDAELAQDITTLRSTMEMLRREDVEPEFTEESYHRILMKLYANGAAAETASPPPMHLQYMLPMAG